MSKKDYCLKRQKIDNSLYINFDKWFKSFQKLFDLTACNSILWPFYHWP